MTSGFRTFTAGEVLTASNVQNYLMDQSVMTFAGSAARSSAIGTANFEEGMTSYLKDTDKLEVYNGTNWVGVAPTTTQGLTLINTTSFSGVASQSVNDVFSATYRNYRVVVDYIPATSSGAVSLRLRVGGADNSTSNYQRSIIYLGASSPAQTRNNNQSDWSLLGNVTNEYYSIVFDLFTPFASLSTHAVGFAEYRATSTSANEVNIYNLGFNGTTSFTGLTVLGNGSNLTGSISVFGYNN